MKIKRQPRQNLGRSRPSIAYELRFRKELQQLVEEMQRDVLKEVRIVKNDNAYDAVNPFVSVFSSLRDKWYRRFTKIGREMAKWLADKNFNRTQTQISRKLKEVGWSIKPTYTEEDKKIIRAIIEDNVNLIKTIPQRFLHDLQGVLTQDFVNGGDLEKMTNVIQRAGRISNNRAALIARDQTNKTTQQLAVVNAKAFGATKGRWIHVPGKYSSRRTHVAMDGKVFNLDVGLYDSTVGRDVKPGELIYCNCQFEVLMPGFDI